jgi:hypothetical protein
MKALRLIFLISQVLVLAAVQGRRQYPSLGNATDIAQDEVILAYQ